MTDPAPLRLAVGGLQVELVLHEGHAALAAELRELWAPQLLDPEGRVEAPGEDPLRLELLAPEETGSAGASRIRPGPGAAYEVSGLITRRVIENLIGRRILLHAGAVDHPRHGTLLLVGPSGAGKSTATSVLARGAGYLSDELGILDPETFAVTGFPKPVSRVEAGTPGLGKRDLSLASLGLSAQASAAAPAQVLLLRRVKDAGAGAPGAALSAVEPAEPVEDAAVRAPLHEALVALAEQSSSLWRVEGGGLQRIAELLTRCGGALALRYREAESITTLLDQAPPGEEEPWMPIIAAAGRGAPRPGEVRVVPFADAVATADGTVVLTAGQVVHLPGLLGLVWQLVCEAGGLEAGELEAEVAEQIGPHPRSRELVEDAIEQLVSAGWASRGATA